MILISIFFYFALNGLNKSLHQEFMSLSIDSGKCQPIKKQISDTFKVDRNGVWNGQVGYVNSLEQFALTATQLQVTDSQYEEVLLLAESVTNALGKSAEYFDLSQALLFWTSWQLDCDTNHDVCDAFKSQSFALAGDSKVFHFTFTPWIDRFVSMSLLKLCWLVS